MQPTPLRAVGYRRVSSQEQTEGYSLEAQEVHIQTYAETQGWQLIRIYTDAGISAKKGSSRPAFEEMLKDARDDQFDVVVVDKLETSVADILKVVLQSGHTHPIHALQAEFLAGEDRFKRACELYLSELLEREEFERENTQFEAYKEILRENNLHATMTLPDCAKTNLDRWSELLPTEPKRLLRLVFEGVWVQRNALVEHPGFPG